MSFQYTQDIQDTQNNNLQIKTIFKFIIKIFSFKKKNNKNFDGQKAWQYIKNILQKYDQYEFSYKEINKDLYENIMSYPEYDQNKKIIEENHFIIQQVRIPNQEKANIRKIIQIGLNIGQWLGFPNKDIFKKIDYEKTQLDKIETYLTEEAIKNMNKILIKDDIENISNYLIELSSN